MVVIAERETHKHKTKHCSCCEVKIMGVRGSELKTLHDNASVVEGDGVVMLLFVTVLFGDK